MSLKKFKIFLAASEELIRERDEIIRLIDTLNKNLTEEEIFLELVTMDDLLRNFKQRGEYQRNQEYIRDEMLMSEIVIAIFDKKINQFSEKEFQLAYQNFIEGNRPYFLFLFFKNRSIPINEIGEEFLKVIQFKEQIREFQQIYGEFITSEELVNKLSKRLELIVLRKYDSTKPLLDEEEYDLPENILERYLESLHKDFEYLDFSWLDKKPVPPLKLEDLYIKLHVKETSTRNPKKQKIGIETLFKEQFNEIKEMEPPIQLLVLGNPGSGKTTLLKWIALQCIKREKKDIFSLFIPVFISLKDMVFLPDKSFLKENVRDWFTGTNIKELFPFQFFPDQEFNKKYFLLLLDGLDEIEDDKTRMAIIHWIREKWMARYAIIITSRPSGLNVTKGIALPDEFPVFEIQDFDTNDIHSFLNKWFQSFKSEKVSDYSPGTFNMERITAILNDKQYIKLHDLVINPLFLSVFASLFQTPEELIKDRYKLYEQCLRIIVYLHNEFNRKIKLNFPSIVVINYLSPLALEFMESNQREMDKYELGKYLPEVIEGKTREFFINEMIMKAGILYESDGKIGFLNYVFQEYLTAYYLSQFRFPGRSVPGKITGDIDRFLADERWHEILYIILKSLFRDVTVEILDYIVQSVNHPPFYIKSIEIDDVKCFKGKHFIDLSGKTGHYAPWTVILGNNGTGKTTLLQSIASLDPSLLNENTMISDIDMDKNEFAVTRSENGNNMFKRIRGKFYCESKNSKAAFRFILKNSHLFLGNEFKIENSNEFFAPFIYAYGASRKSGDASLTGETWKSRFDSLFKDSDLMNVEEWLVQADYAAKKEDKNKANENLDKIKKILLDLLPDVKGFEFKTKGDLRNYVEFETDYGSVPFSGLSLGYRVMISWIVDLARQMFERYPNSENPLAEPSIVLVDEIDLHLHPSWQREIIHFLSHHFPRTQFLVTAHSPLIVQSTEPINLVLLQKDTEHASASIDDSIDVTSFGWTLEEILIDLMGLEKTVSDKYSELTRKFQEAISTNDIDTARKIYTDLDKMLHPANHLRKVMRIQMAGLRGSRTR